MTERWGATAVMGGPLQSLRAEVLEGEVLEGEVRAEVLELRF